MLFPRLGVYPQPGDSQLECTPNWGTAMWNVHPKTVECPGSVWAQGALLGN